MASATATPRLSSLIVRTSVERLLFEALHRIGDGRRHDVSDDVEVRTRLVVADQRLELDAGLLGVGYGVRLVGFELGELQVEALEVELGDVAGLVAIAGDVEFVFVVGEVVVGELLCGLGEDEVGEGLTHGEDGLLDLQAILRVGLGGGGVRYVEAPAALFAAFEETPYAYAVLVGVIECLRRE